MKKQGNIFTCFFILLDSLYWCQCKTNEPSTLVSTDWLHSGKDHCQSACPEILGASQISLLVQSTFFVFLQPQASNTPEQVRWKLVPQTALRKLGSLNTTSNFFPPQREVGSEAFHPLVLYWARGGTMITSKPLPQFSSVQSLSHVRLCDPTDCSTPGLPVHHQLPEFTQTHVHWVSDAIQPPHPVVPFSSCPQSFPASESFQTSIYVLTNP